jgi:hypothetical protein
MKTDDTGRPTFRTYQERGTDIDTRRMRRKGASSQTDVTASRAIDGTVYQNTGTVDMLVGVTAYSTTSGGGITAYSENDATPAVAVGAWYTAYASLSYGQVFFKVPSGWYYKVSNNSATKYAWIEWT